MTQSILNCNLDLNLLPSPASLRPDSGRIAASGCQPLEYATYARTGMKSRKNIWHFRVMGRKEMNQNPVQDNYFETAALDSYSDALWSGRLPRTVLTPRPAARMALSVPESRLQVTWISRMPRMLRCIRVVYGVVSGPPRLSQRYQTPSGKYRFCRSVIQKLIWIQRKANWLIASISVVMSDAARNRVRRAAGGA